jgi:hypothetical protein
MVNVCYDALAQSISLAAFLAEQLPRSLMAAGAFFVREFFLAPRFGLV